MDKPDQEKSSGRAVMEISLDRTSSETTGPPTSSSFIFIFKTNVTHVRVISRKASVFTQQQI